MQPGQTVSGYKILGELGAGTSGMVYLAQQVTMRRVVALKVLVPKERYRSAMSNEDFIREAQTVAQLNHPNIIAIHDAGTLQADGREHLYFAMEFVEGEDLKGRLDREGSCDEATLVRIGGGIGAALAYAATKGMVHRDVKPANIMIPHDGPPKLADFGLVRHRSELTDARIVGTPRYMSPEQARGEPIDFRSDLYSYGCTLFHMITGKVPYAYPQVPQVLRAHCEEEVPDPRDWEDCPEDWGELCYRLMSKEPDDRFEHPASFEAELNRLCRDHELAQMRSAPAAASVSAPAPSQAPARKRAPRRKRRAGARRPAPAKRARRGARRPAPARAAKSQPVAAGVDRGPRPSGLAPAARGPAPPPVRDESIPAPLEIAEEEERRRSRFLAACATLGRWSWAIGRWTWSWIVATAFVVGGWIVARVIAAMPIVKQILYRLVPPSARLYSAIVAPTWKVRIQVGHQHLYLARDDDEHGLVAAFQEGRRLPLVWTMLDERWCSAKADAPRWWIREAVGAHLRPLARFLARTPGERGLALFESLQETKHHPQRGATVTVGNPAKGARYEDAIALAKVTRARVLPVACSAMPSGIFRRAGHRLMIPLPFATVHLSFARPIPVERDAPVEFVARMLAAESEDLQRRLDDLVGIPRDPADG